MHRFIPVLASLAILSSSVWAAEATDPSASSPAAASSDAASEAEAQRMAVNPLTPAQSAFCLLKGKPPADVKFTVVAKVKVGKGTYGSVKQLLGELVDEATGKGADAIVNYTGSQRFGFWPWRMIRPVVYGDAVKWVEPPARSCEALGGKTVGDIIRTDRAPE
ncbi:MAG: hypothetical protein RLZZ618_1603 [Pseudomonadota bacterium]|jgi:hypothetical protein